MTSHVYNIVDSCMISFNLNCIMQLKQFYNIGTKVSCRKKCYYFWRSTWLNIPNLSLKPTWNSLKIYLCPSNDIFDINTRMMLVLKPHGTDCVRRDSLKDSGVASNTNIFQLDWFSKLSFMVKVILFILNLIMINGDLILRQQHNTNKQIG